MGFLHLSIFLLPLLLELSHFDNSFDAKYEIQM